MRKVFKSTGLISLSIGIIYLWFGALKFFPGLSPAEDLARRTIDHLTLGYLKDPAGIVLLAIIEVLIGLGMLTGYLRRTAIWAAIIHMTLCFTPLIFEPQTIWDSVPFDLTLTGQYIIKNLVILSVLIHLQSKGGK